MSPETPVIEPNVDIVLLTGAGASGYLGLATLDELLGRTSVGLADPDVAELIIEVRRMVEGQRPAVSATFEGLIARLRFYSLIVSTLRLDGILGRRVGGLPMAIANGNVEHKIWQALTRCYRALLEEYGPNKIAYDSQEATTAVDLLRSLAELNQGSLRLFTTNYDCSYQVFAANCDLVDFYTHVDSTTGVFGDLWFSSRKDLCEARLPRIFVHRLHGCVGWFNDERVPYRIFEIYGAGGGLEIVHDHVLQSMCIKLVSSEEIGLNAAFLSAFQELYDALTTAKCLLIWGSSFRDREVIRAINSAFYARKEPLPVFYINPFLSEGGVMENIRRTLSPVPVKIADGFKPKQIDWRPRQSGEDLVRETVSVLKGLVETCR